MIRTLGLGIVVLMMFSSIVAANHGTDDKIPVSIYDPLYKKNRPLWTITPEQLTIIEETNSPLGPSKAEINLIRKHVGWKTTEGLAKDRGTYKRAKVTRAPQKRGEKNVKTMYVTKKAVSTGYTPNSREDLTTIYNPITKRNVPYWTLTDDMLDRIEKYNGPHALTKEQIKRIKEKIDYGKKDVRVTVSAKKPVKAKKIGGELTKDEIAEIFGIDNIYDPVFKRNRPIYYISRQRLIEFLNNPVTQAVSFPKRQIEVQETLRELGLEQAGYVDPSTPAFRRKGMNYGAKNIGKPARTYGLLTSVAAKRASGNKAIEKKKRYLNNPILQQYDQTIVQRKSHNYGSTVSTY